MTHNAKIVAGITLGLVAVVALIITKNNIQGLSTQATFGRPGGPSFDTYKPPYIPNGQDEVGNDRDEDDNLLPLNITPDAANVAVGQKATWAFSLSEPLTGNDKRCLSVFWGDGTSTTSPENCFSKTKTSITLLHTYQHKGAKTLSAWAFKGSVGNNTHFGFETVRVR